MAKFSVKKKRKKKKKNNCGNVGWKPNPDILVNALFRIPYISRETDSLFHCQCFFLFLFFLI